MLGHWFSRKRNSKFITIVSPIAGNMIPSNDISDPSFKGVAIRPLEGKVFSPAKGKVTHVTPETCTIGLMTEQGLEINIRLIQDELFTETEEFVILVKEGDMISVGDPLMEFSLQLTDERVENIVSSVMVANMDRVESVEVPPAQTIGLNDWVMRVKLKSTEKA
ncbi:PTS sugar transporter subunit IIA [Heyndrickxia acidiproducens]|uniref:PTS sugar transporter subunit IIA n=1 Tax=Heyndrickxia acidiproducens TaxID=1121084 RepID=UPI0003710527|nr:PTS glucose transporter subunit IIA [Heyndrickxia acidiproducens]